MLSRTNRYNKNEYEHTVYKKIILFDLSVPVNRICFFPPRFVMI